MIVRRLAVIAIIAASAAAAACKKEPATCAQLAPAIRAWGKAELAADHLTGDAASKRTALFELTADLYPRVCAKDGWSGDALDCLVAARTEEEAQQCPLERGQRDSLQKALMDALSGDAGAPHP
jgi:hypothetical protein